MFRRKEDSLFDNTTDPNESEPMESATVITQPTTPAPSSQPVQTSYSNPLPSTGRTMSETRTSAPSASNSFRQTTSQSSGDITRNRLPETKASVTPSQPTSPTPMDRGSNKFGKRVLTVGNDILLKGEIATCDRLVIEGKVDATLNDVHTVEIAESGSFKGSAQIEDAEISGLFEGELSVRGRLVIYATGKVRGKITYGEIEIQRGGELTGEIKTGVAQPATSTRTLRQPAKEDNKVAA